MSALRAPGATFETVDLNRPAVQRLRTDICGFLGYAERGPVDRPVKLRSWRQFIDAFGPPLDGAHTGHAVRLFFENGGDAAYMMRVAHRQGDRGAMTATATLHDLGAAGALGLAASYSAIARAMPPRAADATGPTADPAADPVPSPGAWGNRLAASVIAGGIGTTRSLRNQPEDGASLRVESIAGFVAGSWVRLIQNGDVRDRHARVAAIDPALREILWAAPTTGLGLDFAEPITLETVEFTLRVMQNGEEVERHRDLSLDRAHPRFISAVLHAGSTLLAAQSTIDASALEQPGAWPSAIIARLSGGRDGLAAVVRDDFLAALAQFAAIDEIALLAAPDLVLDIGTPGAETSAPVHGHDCLMAEAPPAGALRGQVLDADGGGPVVGVRVFARNVETGTVLTNAAGEFLLTGLPIGQVAVRMEKPGYTALDAAAQTLAVPPPVPQRFSLALLVLPPVLGEEDIFLVQQAMASQGEAGLYRVALLDVPATALSVEAVQGWRRRFDTSYAALYWPWVIAHQAATATTGIARALPPSGVVAGMIARTDLAEGPQRAPANQPIRGIEAVTSRIDDATHALLNDAGINVLRATPGRGIAVQGARTLSSDAEWRFLNVRRSVLQIAEAIEEAHQWAVFEPNDRVLRDAITHSLTAFLTALWLRGAFAGDNPAAAFAVKCDEENNPPALIDAGQLLAEIAIAPVRPYEFIRLRLGRTDRLRVQGEG